ALGVRKLELLSGSEVVATSNRTCVDWSVLPCSEPSAGLATGAQVSVKVRDTSLRYGAQELRLRVTDGAGNVTTTPAQPIGLENRVPGIWQPSGQGLSSAAERELNWKVDAYDAPITSATIRLCTGTGEAPADCREEAIAPTGPYRFTIGGDGATATARITLTDAAGNSSTSDLIRFSRDASAPAAPVISQTGGTGASRDVTINGEAGARIDAKVCAVGGACADVPTTTAPAVLKVNLPGGGDYDIVATLTDAAGNTSAPGTLRLTRGTVTPEPKSMALAVKVSSNLRKGRIDISGSVAAGSTRRIDVQLIGKSPRGRRVTRTLKLAVPASGRFKVRVKPPRGASVRKTVQLVLTPKPASGWRVTHYTHTIRP
ncbi:MAG: Ig-like domain repeat protein, partial [Patulibacter minatonensis]